MDLLQIANSVKVTCGPEFIKKSYLSYRPATAHPTWGNCYVACEALYHLGAKKAGFKLRYVTVLGCPCSLNCKGGNHFFLFNPDNTIAAHACRPGKSTTMAISAQSNGLLPLPKAVRTKSRTNCCVSGLVRVWRSPGATNENH